MFRDNYRHRYLYLFYNFRFWYGQTRSRGMEVAQYLMVKCITDLQEKYSIALMRISHSLTGSWLATPQGRDSAKVI